MLPSQYLCKCNILEALTIFSGEQRLAAEHLGQNAAYAPHINSFGVLLEGEHNLRRSIPSRSHVFRHEPRIVLCRSSRPGKAEIADFQVTIGIQKQVGRLQVTV